LASTCPLIFRSVRKALDDATAAKLLRAAQTDRRMLVRVTVEGLSHIRHTLATQPINRGMSLEAIAALLGHRSLDMTLRYAKIASRTSLTSTSPSESACFWARAGRA
jgi:site-specific recombinase XerD